MRKLLVLLAVVFFLPSLSYAQEGPCDIGIYVKDLSDSTALDSILVACWSYEDEEFAWDSTTPYGPALISLHNWPDSGGCDQNYGDYRVCLPWFWEYEDVYFEYEGDCSQQSGCEVTFYIEEASKKPTPWCIDLSK